MNIDFHYGVIYVVARWAGMERSAAETVAHACQYIDDSTVSGVLEFEDGQTYERFAAAHDMIDYRNFLQIRDKLVWATFHFLPGGEGHTFEEKCVCKPNSAPAKEMVRRGLQCTDAENALHRLGVTLHVYVDTWAHQNFSGIKSHRNVIHELTSQHHHREMWIQTLVATIRKHYDVAESEAIGFISKVGHGAALHFPDMPWAVWSYENALGEHIERNNLPDFMDAADNALRVIRAFRNRTDEFESQPGLSAEQKNTLQTFLEGNNSEDPDERLKKLAEALSQGSFAGLNEALPGYAGKGKRSWKESAVGITANGQEAEIAEEAVKKPKWGKAFEDSDYRKYHDAVKQHRLVVTHDVLPIYGIRLA